VSTAGETYWQYKERDLIQFRSNRRLFHRHRFSWWKAAVLITAPILLYCLLAPSVKDAGVEASAVVAPAAEQMAFVAPRPNMIEQRAETAPVPATEDVSSKPVAPLAVESSLEDQLSSFIQDNISSKLESGSKALVSAKKVIVRKGDTFMELLQKANVPSQEAYQVVLACKDACNPRDLQPGREITVFFHKDPAIADPKFSGVRIEKDIINAVTVNRGDNGHYTINKEEKDVHRTLRGFKGTIDSSLYVDAKNEGVPDSVILELIKMYSWNVDFQRGIHAGDKFEVMYEEYKTEDDKTVPGRGNIVYAKLTLDGDEMPFYRYADKTGLVDYYDDDGQSAKKPLMKTPIDGARLSSGFGMRKHPVLGYSKMHKGVDFAAPRGTPIYAAGDGTIEKIGPFSTYGNYIRIRHRNSLKTAYAHMKGFKAGLHSGSHVKQGEVIGYVGTTGRSTGPHLHYEVLVNNDQVNPGSVKLPTGNALKGKDLKAFKSLVASTRTQFRDLSRSTTDVADSGR
jgi:murein DD-endopeptidase MepM/ murein hydrolase activator NlpD